MSTIIDGTCSWCESPVKITKYDPPKKGKDEDGEYLLLEYYDCESCNIISEKKVRRVI